MTSRKRDDILIFDYERPGTPTAIRGSFSHHGTLGPTDSLEGNSVDHEDDNSPLPTPTNPRASVHIEAHENSINHGDNQTEHGCSFFITEYDELTPQEQLPLAHERIKDLEKRLEILERELRLSQERAKKLASQGTRLRRMARSGDLFRRAQPTAHHNDIDPANKTEPLGRFITLTVSSIYSSSEATSDNEPPCLPLYMRRFEGQVYAICTRGATIGSNPFCGICIPEEAGLKEFHASIKWNEAAKHFELSSGTSSESEIYISDNPNEVHLPAHDPSHDTGRKVTSLILKNQQKFRTGMVEWTVAPVPRRRLIVARMFDALRWKNMEELHELWLEAKSWNGYLHRLTVNKMAKSQFYIDGSTEEDTDYILIDEEAKRFPKPSDSFNETPLRRNQQFFASGDKPEKFSLLHVATDYCFLNGVKFVLEKGAQVNKQCGTTKQSPLHISVRRNNLDITRELLYYGADLELTDSRHLSAVALAETYPIRKMLLSSLMLCAAADGGDFDEVKRLIETGTSPNAKALSHKAPLHLASLNGHVKVVEFLLEHKALINATGGRRHRTALHYASLANNVEIVKLLMKYNPDQEIVDSMGYTALNLSNGGEICRMLHQNPLSLCLASQAGDVEEVRSILEAQSLSRKTSINEAYVRRISRTTSGRKISQNVAVSNFGLCLAVDQRNVQGHAPLHLASAAGNLELVQLLVSYGAWVDLPGGLDKWTALFYAALAGHSEVVGFLLAIGADPHIVDAQGLTVEEHVEQNIEEMKEKLDRKGFREPSFDQDTSSQETQTLLAPAQLHRQRSDSSLDNKGQRSWMKKQIGRLEHVLSVLQSGQQKLLNALEKRDMQLLKDVLENEDVKINEPLSKHTQTTALCLAAVSGMPEFVRVLLKHDADPKVSDGMSQTPLHAAAKAGHEDVIQVLLKNGVDINIRTNSMRQTPLHIAASNSHIDVVRFLIQKGADRDARDIEGRTPFDMVEDLDIKDLLATGNNLLYVAIAKGDLNVVSKKIKEDEIPVDITFAAGLSPLQIACSHERAEIAEFLISQKADVNFQGGPNALSPLHLAVQGKSTEIAKMLVENSAKVSAKDADGKTPFEVAKSNSMRKVLVDAKPYRKSEMLHLEDQNADSSSDEDLSRKNLCRICFDNPANTIVLPCGHQAFCKNCASQLEMCAFDRRPISQVIAVFRVAED